MTVREMEERMDNEEFIRWSVYFGRQVQRQQLEQQGRR